ncbi:MAG: DUF58 domain-containing protein [Acidobacteria bacterium]|nr:DUF58 domain-containing protein [Acidobacteriota bacterium]
MARQELKIEKAFLERLERLTIHWQKSFPGVVGGHNASRFSGPGQEFLDHRNFSSGDDLRAVNWRAYMRLEKMFLKLFTIEPRVPIRLFLDSSASMNLGGKWDYARRLAAAITYVGLVRLDAMQLIPFRESLEEGLACGGGRHQFSPVADYLSALEATGKTDFNRVVREFLGGGRQKGLIIVISDFLGEEDWMRPLQYLADYGHELTLIQVWNDEDRTPAAEGDLEITEVESGKQVKLTFDTSARQQYTDAFDVYAEELRRLALRNQGRYSGLPTSTNVEDAVFGALVATQGLR